MVAAGFLAYKSWRDFENFVAAKIPERPRPAESEAAALQFFDVPADP
jgi:hypothetical protein